MTSFKDVLRPLTTQLHALSIKTGTALARYESDTTQFQTYVTSNIAGVSGKVSFLGQGADACVAAVRRNVSRAQHVTTKLHDVKLACDQTSESLNGMSVPFDEESYYHLSGHDLYGSLDFENADRFMTFVAQYFREGQGYSSYDATDLNSTIISRIREDTLPNLDGQLDALLTPGKGQGIMEDNIDYAVSCINGNFQQYRSQRHEEMRSYLASKELNQEAFKYYDATVDNSYDLAVHYVSVIGDKMKLGYTEWVTEFQALVGQFQEDLIAAAEIGSSSVGDLIAEVTAPGMNGKVYLWQTTNGLVVLVKGGTTSLDVENAIQKYLSAHGLDKSKTAVTLLGYQEGGSVAQQMVLDEEGADKNYHVTNLVLVGSELNDNLPANLNSFVYNVQTQEKAESESTLLGLKPDQIGIPIAAVFLGLMTDGIGDAGLFETVVDSGADVGKELILAKTWNEAEKLGEENSEEHIPEKLSVTPSLPIFIDLGDGSGVQPISVQQETLLASGQLPKKAKIYFEQSSVVPAEPGSNLTNFTQSSYLNSQAIPDPGSDKLIHGGALPVQEPTSK